MADENEAIVISHLFETVVPEQVIVLPTSIKDVAPPAKVIAVVVLFPVNKTLADELMVSELIVFAPSTITVTDVLKTTSSMPVGVPPDQLVPTDQVPPEAPIQIFVAAFKAVLKKNSAPITRK